MLNDFNCERALRCGAARHVQRGALCLRQWGLYGLVAWVVGLSRRVIAARLALGASGSRIVALVVRNGITLVLWGC